MGSASLNIFSGGTGRALAVGSRLKLLSGSFTFSNSYTTGGEALDLSEHFKELLGVVFESKGGYLFSYDYSTKKVKAYTPTVAHSHSLKITGGQAAGDALQVLSGVIGKQTADDVTASGGNQNILNSSAAAATEVAATTNLSAIGAVRFLAWGW